MSTWRSESSVIGSASDYAKRVFLFSNAVWAACITNYYLDHKRSDLPLLQQRLLMSCGWLYTMRYPIQTFYTLTSRPVPSEELYGLPFWLPITYLVPSYFAKQRKLKNSLDYIDYIGIGMTVIGHLFVIISEAQRKIFKSKPENKGKLYTSGLNSITRHPNHFGEVLLIIGWSLFSRNRKLALVWPSIVITFLYGYVVPDLEQYLKTRYSSEWPDYAKNVKNYIPFIL